MIVIQFTLGGGNSTPINVTIQETGSEVAVAQLTSFLKAMQESKKEEEDDGEEGPPEGTPWFKPPVSN